MSLIDYEFSSYGYRGVDIEKFFRWAQEPQIIEKLNISHGNTNELLVMPSADERRHFSISYLDEIKKKYISNKNAVNEIEFDESEDGAENLLNFEMEIDLHLMINIWFLRLDYYDTLPSIDVPANLVRSLACTRRYIVAKENFLRKYSTSHTFLLNEV